MPPDTRLKQRWQPLANPATFEGWPSLWEDLARDRDAAGLDFEHARMDIIDGVQPIDRGGTKCPEKLGTVQTVVQRQPAHQRPVYEKIDTHSLFRLTRFGASAALGRSLLELL